MAGASVSRHVDSVAPVARVAVTCESNTGIVEVGALLVRLASLMTAYPGLREAFRPLIADGKEKRR